MTGLTKRHEPVHQRADAVRKRADILAAARIVFVERGADVPMDEIARRAEVGNATLYRHFPDRATLIREVVREVFAETLAATETAIRDEPSAMAALIRYMHAALDIGIAAVMPVLAGPVEVDDALERDRLRGVALMEDLIRDARDEGALRPDAAFGDIGLMLIRLSRSLPGTMPHALDRQVAHRHLAIYVDGLRATGGSRPPLPGPPLDLAGIRSANARAPAEATANAADEPAGGPPSSSTPPGS